MARNCPKTDSRPLPRWLAVAAAAALLCGALGCQGAKGRKNSISIYAGAGMKPAMDKLIAAFKQQTGIDVEADYQGSGIIVTRARADEEADLFIPGDEWYVDLLQEQTGVIESRATIAYFVPVIIVRKDRKITEEPINSLEDLLNKKNVKVGLGNPKACQVGRISDVILEKIGRKRSELNLKEALTVNELAPWVATGDVDAAIVWDATAANFAHYVRAIEIPMARGQKDLVSRVVAGLMKTSKKKDLARKFLDFLTSQRGRAILKESGYLVDPPW
ncbi:MAG TPA: molybdate ABC transporter substrate-binding protein [Phycisphaerae bacterium]|nr:molybdate ABC transporter substrate-binding protein [Phycisphaerae bacterium]